MKAFQKAADEFFRDLERYADNMLAASSTIGRLMSRARSVGRNFRVVSFASDGAVPPSYRDAGFFVAPDGTTLISGEGIELLCAQVDADERAGVIGSALAADFRRTAIELYLAHEIYHQEQGLIQFEHVQVIKAAYGSGDVLGHLDLLADMAAVHLVANLEVMRHEPICLGVDAGDRVCLARHVLSCLMVAGVYAPRAFGCPTDKPHKVRRALGLTISAAVAWKIVNGDPNYSTLETVEPFWAVPGDSDGSVILSAFKLAPVAGVWPCVKISENDLARWLAHARAGRFAAAVSVCLDILDYWQPLELKSAVVANPATS